jgi:TRAP-type transport system periplasmic protein
LVLFSKKIWDGLSSEEQSVLKECALVGQKEQRKVNREKAEISLANLKKEGMQVNEIAPEEMARLRDKLKVIYDRHAASIGRDTLDLVNDELKRIRGN